MTSTDNLESKQQQDSSPISNVNCFASATTSFSSVCMKAASSDNITQFTKSGLSRNQL